MHLQTIPRGTLPVSESCIDMLSGLEPSQLNTHEMKRAVTVVSSYMLDRSAYISDGELAECLAMVEKLYLP